ncbi:hypothetical protein [Zunongwangia profunda]|uniref:hypothetical protein n=1 Tax=Zunongwangia profunda TaxID=398743 RepID=UPI00248D5363|nr:hypothetical protein [Zunongwangia profunda]|tara:strand:- start:23102 stop:23539 length:438 start_codon:yes stop_codon:yes gene_type:complete
MEVTFDLESNPDVGFYALYAGLKMFSDKKAEETKGTDKMNVAGAEAYAMLQDLKEQFPEKFNEAQEAYIRSQVDKWLLTEDKLLKVLRVQSNLNPNDFRELFGDRGDHLFQLFARDSWNLISFLFNKVNGEEREKLIAFVNSKID